MREQNDKIEKFFNKVDKITFKVIKIMAIFIPLFVIIHLLISCENEQTIVCECANGQLIVEDILNPHIDECDKLCIN